MNNTEQLFKKLPLLNIQRKQGRSIALAGLVAILACSLFVSSYLSLAMSKGMEQVSQRLGADFIVLPKEAESKYENALIAGEASSFYMDRKVLDVVKEQKDIAKASPQLYLATLDASCCAFPTQIMAVDFDTDFSIGPWLKNQLKQPIGANQGIGGAGIITEVGKKTNFFNQGVEMVGKLEPTGMGLDNTVFVNFEEGEKLMKAAQSIGVSEISDPQNQISAVVGLIDPNSKRDVVNVIYDLNVALRQYDAKAIKANLVMKDASQKIDRSFSLIRIILLVFWLLGVIVLLIVFPMIVKTRTPELALLRTLGADTDQIKGMLGKEMAILSLIGALSGTVLGYILVLLYRSTITANSQIPYLDPSFLVVLALILGVFLISFLVGPLISLVSLRSFNQKEIAIASTDHE